MKHTLLFTFVALNILSFSGFSQTGFSCATPISINTLPYTTIDNTANYGDTTDTSPPYACLASAGNYMSGNDVFYSYTPATDSNINITMSPIATYSAIIVYDGCANVGIACLAAMGNSNTSPRVIPSLPVIAGHNYIIAISTWATPQTTAYNLSIQNLNCAEPSLLSASGSTLNSAQLSWTGNGTATSWQVAIQSPGAGIPNGPGTSVTASTYLATALAAGTTYEYWVRSDCGDGTFSLWAGPKLFNTTVCESSSQCLYNFVLTDTYGDGWNGNTMSVLQNGIVVGTFGAAFDDGTASSASVPLCDGVPFQLHWNSGGEFYEEVGLVVLNSFGQAIYTKAVGTGHPNTDLYTGHADCVNPACLKPATVAASNISWDSATFSWAESGNATQWEVLVLPSSSTAPTAASIGVVTSTNPHTVTGLTAGTTYNFYVRSMCSNTLQSEWSAPKYFRPTCPAPHYLTVSSVTGTGATLGWLETGTATQWEVIILPSGSAPPAATASGIATSVNSYMATGLTLGHTYKFYVRASCGAGVNSTWSPPHTFTPTEPLPPLAVSTTQYTTEELVSTVLVSNPCISITNVTSSTGSDFGTVNGIGYFTNTNPTFPITSGIVLSTGNVASSPGPNTSTLSEGDNALWPGDDDLETLILSETGQAMDSQNATVLEFDFSTLNEFMSFNFLFASEEYGYYQCEYADAFAFLLTDSVTGVTTNLAVVPGTSTPVSVVTIRDNQYNNGCGSSNDGYFDTFFEGINAQASATNFNGQTALMTASSVIIPNHPYHIKLVVADRWDELWDSAVFIEAGSFTAGPPQCTDQLQLVAFVDENGNGIKDNQEKNFTYGTFSSQHGGEETTHVTSPRGVYTIYNEGLTSSYNLGYAIDPEYAAYYTAAPVNFTAVSIVPGSGTQVLYFPVILAQPFNDVAVSIVPLSNPVPGFNFTNKIVYRNFGLASSSGTLTYSKDAQVVINAVSEPGAITTATGFSYSFSNLTPGESRSILVNMQVPSMPDVLVGDNLNSAVSITAAANDISLTNNLMSSKQQVVSSFDPNTITEIHGDKIPVTEFPIDEYLYYTIRFQNTGTANANDIRLDDVLGEKIEPTSIRMVSASHDYIMERQGNQVAWKVNYINLQGALESEEMSKGYVSFKVQLKPGYGIGDLIPNGAAVGFDSNPSISTNTFTTLLTGALGTNEYNSGFLTLYPNPTSHAVRISTPNGTGLKFVTIFDVLGKALNTWTDVADESSLDLSSLASGVYLVEMTTMDNRHEIRKLIKQ
jgi:hypothetical protein